MLHLVFHKRGFSWLYKADIISPFYRWKNDDYKNEIYLSICCFDTQNQFPYSIFSLIRAFQFLVFPHWSSTLMCWRWSAWRCGRKLSSPINVLRSSGLSHWHGIAFLRLKTFVWKLLGWESSPSHWAWTWKHVALELLASITSPSGGQE